MPGMPGITTEVLLRDGETRERERFEDALLGPWKKRKGPPAKGVGGLQKLEKARGQVLP